MSDELTLAARIQDAIQAHLTANGSGFPTEFVLITNYIDDDGESSYLMACSPDQTVSASLGLLRWGTLGAEADARHHFDSRLEDE